MESRKLGLFFLFFAHINILSVVVYFALFDRLFSTRVIQLTTQAQRRAAIRLRQGYGATGRRRADCNCDGQLPFAAAWLGDLFTTTRFTKIHRVL